MPNVRRIADYQNRDTILALQALLDQAIAGNIAGVALCYKTRPFGVEEIVMTGHYEGRPSDALAAAMRFSWRLTQAIAEVASP